MSNPVYGIAWTPDTGMWTLDAIESAGGYLTNIIPGTINEVCMITSKLNHECRGQLGSYVVITDCNFN